MEQKVGILTASRIKGQPRICLAKLGVVSALREAEAARRGMEFPRSRLSQTGQLERMPVWFAHEVGGKIVNLFNGSKTTDVLREWQTAIPWGQIVRLVRDCLA